MSKPHIAILGLGEAGSHFANDLVQLDYKVSGWDPDLQRNLDERVHFADSNAQAVEDADIIFNVNLTTVAPDVAQEVKKRVKQGALFCEMNTSSPNDKREIQTILQTACKVVDVAIMAPVPKKGIRTPFLISGPDAQELQTRLAECENIKRAEGPVGKAAQMKLMRSIVYKGIAGVICEAMEAAEAFDSEDFMRHQILSIMGADESLIDRFLTGSKTHAVRRSHEMEAVTNMLERENLSALMSNASLNNLLRYIDKY